MWVLLSFLVHVLEWTLSLSIGLGLKGQASKPGLWGREVWAKSLEDEKDLPSRSSRLHPRLAQDTPPSPPPDILSLQLQQPGSSDVGNHGFILGPEVWFSKLWPPDPASTLNVKWNINHEVQNSWNWKKKKKNHFQVQRKTNKQTNFHCVFGWRGLSKIRSSKNSVLKFPLESHMPMGETLSSTEGKWCSVE